MLPSMVLSYCLTDWASKPHVLVEAAGYWRAQYIRAHGSLVLVLALFSIVPRPSHEKRRVWNYTSV